MSTRILDIGLWLLVGWPLAYVLWAFYQVQFAGDLFYLGADPIEAIIHFLGEWSVWLLWLVILMPVLQRKTRLPFNRYRRRVGVSVFLYVLLHGLSYFGLMQGFDLTSLIEDLNDRPYVVVGFLALVALTPLVITSTKGWQRRLKKKWKSLHKLVYPIAVLSLLHVWWQVKASFGYAVLITLLLVIILIVKFLPAYLARVKTSSNL